MTAPGFTRKIKPLDLLSEDQIQEIHRASLDILRQTGVTFANEWALQFLEKNGCIVDYEQHRVRFPEGLVEACLRQAPSSFRLRARNPKHDLILGGNTVHYSQSAGMQTIDLDTFEPRPPSRQDYIECITVLDQLPTVSHLSCYPYFGYQGVSPDMAILESIAMKMRFSSKHQFTCYSKGSEVFTIQMAQAVGVEVTGTITASPPLTWDENAVNVARRMVEAGFPVATVDGYTLGGTGPATVAGTVAVSNAQHLSMIVLVQLLHPGHPISVGHFACPMNMASGSPIFGEICSSLSNAMWNQMWRWYGVPRGNGSPGYVSSKLMDYQAGYEKAVAALIAAQSGANYILLHLGVSGELTAHPVQAILDNDLAGMIGRFIQGEEVNAETIALELIEEVGPIPGHYLNRAHTRQWWKREQFIPQCADRLTYPDWLNTGKRSALDYARKRFEEIIATHRPELPSDSQDEAIERVLEDARAHYRNHK